jgi:hypothetical protein
MATDPCAATHTPPLTRTAWAVDPERVDPDDYAPQAPFVKLITCAPCRACDLPVHTPLTRFLLQGLHCPHCGGLLLSPPADAMEHLTRVMDQEDQLTARLYSDAH